MKATAGETKGKMNKTRKHKSNWKIEGVTKETCDGKGLNVSLKCTRRWETNRKLPYFSKD